jgi:GntR family transcriptional regulator
MKNISKNNRNRQRAKQILHANLRPKAADDNDPIFALSSATPIYVQLILLFRQQIENGKWPIGSKIPILEELGAKFKVARATIRQALNFLEHEGLIARSRGRGTFITAKPHGRLFMDIPSSWRKIVDESERVVGNWADLSAPLPNLTEIKEGTLAPKYQVLRRVLSRDSVPYLVGTSSLDRRLIDELGMDWLRRITILQFVHQSRLFKVASGTQSMHIDSADAEVSYLLHIPLNAPIVIVRRALFDQKSILIYHSEGLFRGDFIRIKRQLIMRDKNSPPAPRRSPSRAAGA